MTSELEKKKLELEAIKKQFQETYKNSAQMESFHSWIQNGTWGNPLHVKDLMSYSISEDEAQKKVTQKEKNNQIVKDCFFQCLSEKAPFSTEFMCEMHSFLFNRVIYLSGFYREDNVRLNNVAIDVPSYQFVFTRMNCMETTYNNSEKKVFDILRLNYDIVVTQPFIDGNKAIARTMLNYELLNQGYPPVLFSSKADREDYITSIEKSYNEQDLTPFYSFMSEKMASTSAEAMLILQGKNIETNVQLPTIVSSREQTTDVSTTQTRQKE